MGLLSSIVVKARAGSGERRAGGGEYVDRRNLNYTVHHAAHDTARSEQLLRALRLHAHVDLGQATSSIN